MIVFLEMRDVQCPPLEGGRGEDCGKRTLTFSLKLMRAMAPLEGAGGGNLRTDVHICPVSDAIKNFLSLLPGSHTLSLNAFSIHSISHFSFDCYSAGIAHHMF